MTTLVDTRPDTTVQVEEYIRLLGFPRGWELRDRSLELAAWARDWYARRGRPWVYAREAHSLDVRDGAIHIDGVAFTSARLAKTLLDAGAHTATLVAASAGPELEAETQRLWQEGKPDEYFFLEVYGSAVVEHLVTMTGARLCASFERQQMAVLPHYSPGYPEWPIEEQGRLLALMQTDLVNPGPAGPGLRSVLEVLDSGMLRPKKSLLAVFGVTRQVDRVRPLSDLVPCEHCSFGPCQYRRVPYKRAAAGPKYHVNLKALRRWANERLTLTCRTDGNIDAVFRYDGTTCTNMGRPIEFRYEVMLGPRTHGYPILRQHCGPAPGDAGHAYMCQYISHPAELMSAIKEDAPLAGRPLDEVLGWTRPACSAGCYCEADARLHKWGLVLETIHYALNRPASGIGHRASAEEPHP
jgi:hypothetical protein